MVSVIEAGPVVEAPPVEEVKAEPLALWPTREKFLYWCRERGVKGYHPSRSPRWDGRSCLVAEALREVTGREYAVGRSSYLSMDAYLRRCRDPVPAEESHPLPGHLTQITIDFDEMRLPQEFYT